MAHDILASGALSFLLSILVVVCVRKLYNSKSLKVIHGSILFRPLFAFYEPHNPKVPEQIMHFYDISSPSDQIWIANQFHLSLCLFTFKKGIIAICNTYRTVLYCTVQQALKECVSILCRSLNLLLRNLPYSKLYY